MTTPHIPAISIIVGSINARHSIQDCLNSLTKQAAVWNAEVVLVDASSDGTSALVSTEFPKVRILKGRANALVPQLWKLGLEAANAPIVAFTVPQCIVGDDWLQRISAVDWNIAAGVGGPIEGPLTGRSLDWAWYLARYSAYMSEGKRGFINEIPGDNAAYQKALVLACEAEIREGFWETLVHVRLRANGHELLWLPEMRARLLSSGSWRDCFAARFRHGRHYGSTRPGNTTPKRLARLVASPLILPTLLFRIIGRVRAQRPDWTPQLFAALPALITFLSAWTLGEISGYLLPQKS